MRPGKRLGAFAALLLLASLRGAHGNHHEANPLKNRPSPQEQQEGFVSLFNGEGLSGWRSVGRANDWTVDDGVLVTEGSGGWLRTERFYTDFVLKLEYRCSVSVGRSRTNSGVFLRATEAGDPAFTGMEIQILDDAGLPPDRHSTGALYAASAPLANWSRPAGQWNDYTIELRGSHLKVWLNTVQIQDIPDLYGAELARIVAEEKHPTLASRARTGYIGLQSHTGRVGFRNIRLRVLSVSEARQ